MNRYSGGSNVIDAGALFAPLAPLIILTILSDTVVYDVDMLDAVLLWVLGLLISYVLIIVHEVAHWSTAKLLGIKITSVTIGHWRKLFSFTLDGIPVTFRALPASGFVTVGNGYHSTPTWRVAVFLAAGCGAELVLIGLFVSRGLSLEDTTTFLGLVHAFAVINVVWSVFWHMLANLVPSETKIAGTTMANDGLQLVQLWTERKKRPKLRQLEADIETLNSHLRSGDRSAALQQVEFLAASHPDHPNLSITAGVLFAENGDLAKAERLWRDLLHKSLPPATFAEVFDMLCSLVINYDRKDLLREADMWSSEALRYSPLAITLKGTRGSILIEMGRIEEGIAMLHDVQKHSECPVDQAICAAYLAKAHAKNADSQAAQRYLAAAQSINPEHAVVRKVAQELGMHGRC